ncbi:MAG: maltose ABC transporter permease MalF [Anaerolineae bacterium]|nr:maltose ABC transporter permease MalF [Anaerolineae bacterium]
MLKYAALFIGDAIALLLIYTLLHDDNLLLAAILGVIAVMLNVVVLVPRLYPIKWMSPGLALVTLLVIYPIIYTVITAFTNYSDGHLLTKEQMIDLVEKQVFLPETGKIFSATVFQSGSEYALWLVSEDGTETFFARPDQPFETVQPDPASEDGIPAEFEGYQRLDPKELVKIGQALQNMSFGEEAEAVRITQISPRRGTLAKQVQPRYIHDPETNTVFDQQAGVIYYANDEIGCFVPEGVQACGLDTGSLIPGYRVTIGFDNFKRIVTDPGFRGPLVNIFLWTVLFAFMSVFTTFAMGLFMALILNDPIVPGRKIIRSLLIIPYSIPGVIGILIWRGLLNQNLGIISVTLQSMNIDLLRLTDPWGAKVAIIVVNLWLGYPYMMLVCSGALQAIPSDVYEAAAVDGAGQWNRFWQITLPLLLVTVGPLLIASFTFNFNNYLMIEALTEGNPAMPDTPTPAGYSDILISYTYELAFGSDRGADYGYASAITLLIFLVTAGITLFQYRFTKTWEEVGENV